MALSNLVFTGGQAPNLAGPGLQVVANRPNPYNAFAKGYDDQQKRELALQQYREAKLKADLAEALYPMQSQLQQKMLEARLNALTNPTSYGVPASPIVPLDTAKRPTAQPDGAGNGGTRAVVTPSYNPTNPFNGPSPGLNLQNGVTPTYAPFQGLTTDAGEASFNPFDDMAA